MTTSASKWVLSVDPGDTTGWAILAFEGGELMDSGQSSITEFMDKLDSLDPASIKVIVAEDFILYANKAQAQTGSRFVASQVIGMLKAYARKDKIPVVMQQARLLPIAEKWSGVAKPKNHSISHWVDAYNHGFYYLCKIGKAKHKAEQ